LSSAYIVCLGPMHPAHIHRIFLGGGGFGQKRKGDNSCEGQVRGTGLTLCRTLFENMSYAEFLGRQFGIPGYPFSNRQYK